MEILQAEPINHKAIKVTIKRRQNEKPRIWFIPSKDIFISAGQIILSSRVIKLLNI